jgi:hypothetical protein
MQSIVLPRADLAYNGSEYAQIERFRFLTCNFVLRAGLECYLIDSNVVLFGDFLDIWSWILELEFASDDSENFRSKNMISLPSSRLVHMAPSELVRSICDDIVQFSIMQNFGNNLLAGFFGIRLAKYRDDAWYIQYGDRLQPFEYVEPWRGPNLGVLLCPSIRRDLCMWARRRSLMRPVAVSLPPEKFESQGGQNQAMRILRLLLEESDCRAFRWSFWRQCDFPFSVVCNISGGQLWSIEIKG